MKFIPITYCIVEEYKLGNRASVFHLLKESEIALLRCFMSLLYFPANTSRIFAEQPLFVEAIMRMIELPDFRIVNSKYKPPENLWKDMLKLPLLIIMIGDSLPLWFKDLSKERPLGVLTSSEDVVSTISAIPGVYTGLLKGTEDIRECYRVINELATAGATLNKFDQDTTYTLRALSQLDLYSSRPKLNFLPALPLPNLVRVVLQYIYSIDYQTM